MAFRTSVTKLTWRTLVFFCLFVFVVFFYLPARRHANPFDKRGWLSGPKNNVTLLSLCQEMWINSMQSVCQKKYTRRAGTTNHPLFSPLKNFPDNDKMSCNSLNHIVSTHPGWYVCNCRGGFLHIFEPWHAAAPIITTFSFFFFQTSCNMSSKKMLGIIVVFLLY